MTTPPPVANVLQIIGNTRVVHLRRLVPENHADVYLEFESVNPTGSYKDRMAKSMIEEARAPRRSKIRDDDLVPSMARRAQEIAGSGNCYLTNQFSNRDSFVGYEGIGHELVQQFPEGIDAFCGAVGTGGMVMGASRVLKFQRPETRTIVLEPASSPILTEDRTRSHGVEGIGLGFVPPHLEKSLYNEVRAISEEGRQICRRLARGEDLLVGTSTGLNVAAALALAKELGPGKTVVTVAVDTGLKYLNGTLFTE